MTGGWEAGSEAGGRLCCSPFETGTADAIKRPSDILKAGLALTRVRSVAGTQLAGIQLPGSVATLTESIMLHIQCKGAVGAPALHRGGLAEQEEAGGRGWGRMRSPSGFLRAPGGAAPAWESFRARLRRAQLWEFALVLVAPL